MYGLLVPVYEELGCAERERAGRFECSEHMDRLFMAMAEELKLPLQHIARQAELSVMSVETGDNILEDEGTTAVREQPLQSLRSIQTSADMTIQLLDSYLLSLRLSMNPETTLELEPVSASAVVYDAAAELQHIAQSYGVALDLHIQGRYEPVLANRRALRSALVALGHALIEALPAAGVERQRLQLATHRTKQGIVAGIYGSLDELTPQAFRKAHHLHGRVRQPLVGVLPGSGAGVFVADTILGAMESRLRVGRFMKMPGFAVTLPTSEQLQLV